MGEGEGGMIWENGIETCMISYKKWKTKKMSGASMRNSAHGKGHEEGGLAYAKAWSSLRKPPVPEHLPQNQSLFYALTYTSDFMGGSPP